MSDLFIHLNFRPTAPISGIAPRSLQGTTAPTTVGGGMEQGDRFCKFEEKPVEKLFQEKDCCEKHRCEKDDEKGRMLEKNRLEKGHQEKGHIEKFGDKQHHEKGHEKLTMEKDLNEKGIEKLAREKDIEKFRAEKEIEIEPLSAQARQGGSPSTRFFA